MYEWITPDPAAPFQPAQQGRLLLRFGGPYSSISPALGRPYADEFNIGAELRIGPRSIASMHLFRRDEKNRIAAIDTGLPAQAFTPVSILDPGPDGITGTFDDQKLTVYAQDPATFGQDHYRLTNPPGPARTQYRPGGGDGHIVARADTPRVLRGGEVIRTYQPGRCVL